MKITKTTRNESILMYPKTLLNLGLKNGVAMGLGPS